MKTQFRIRVKFYAILFGLISLNGSGQVQIGQDINGDTLWHGLGSAMSLSTDGNTVAIGCWNINNLPKNYNNGSVQVYGKKASRWVQIGGVIESETNHRVTWGEESGRAISLSDDGTVLAIGARGNDVTYPPNPSQREGSNEGHVRVFKKVEDAPSPGGFKWEQIGKDIDGTQVGSQSGFDVSLSGDGKVVAIGAPFFDGDGLSKAGLLRVYKRDANDNWVQIGNDIVGQSEGERLGASVSISDDGNTLAVVALNLVHNGNFSSPRWNSEGLITRVYQNVNDNWVQVGDFMSDEGTIYNEEKGGAVRLTGDGNVLAITSYVDRSVRVYERGVNNNKWTLKGNELRGPFGYGIALSDDARTLAVGTPNVWLNNINHVGSVHIYKYSSNNTWQEINRINGSHRSHLLGNINSLSLSADGLVLAMGSSDYGYSHPSNLVIGRARMYNIGVSGVSIQGAPAAVNTTDPFEVTFTFDRGVTDFNKEDIAVTNATVGNFKALNASTYTADITPTSLCGDDNNITINIPVRSAFDIGSNMPNLAAQEVVVNTGVVAVARDITVQLAPNGLATISPEDVDNGSGHNCGNGGAVMLSLDRDTFTCSDVGTPVTVALTATLGNQTDISTAVVTVENNTNSLVAVAKDITVRLNADGRASISPSQIDNGSGSGCNNIGSISLSLDKNVFSCEDVGMATVELTATQGSEIATATATVTVEEYLDNLEAIAKNITVQLDADGQATILPEDVDNGSTYGCGSTPELSVDINTFDCDDVGAPVTVTLTATQGNNSEITTAQVTVEATGDCGFATPQAPSSFPMIPTAFTPNGDGANDRWIIDHLSEDASVRIYDRHGTIIFSSNDGYTRPWDGTSRGSRLPAGSYLYLIQNGPHTYRGSVTILL